jgi:hypothetical protein
MAQHLAAPNQNQWRGEIIRLLGGSSSPQVMYFFMIFDGKVNQSVKFLDKTNGYLVHGPSVSADTQ